ncbi:hypothetical protein PRVXH_002310 [Proteinivorax hydrogeniformans]|uniref:Uncharacterized protein n=2 Tax=Proteinivorax TaxID=1491776 RepID=A0AAU7VKR0_9FIRM
MDPYETLANAIILQSVKDYRASKHPSNRASIERFFRSGWFRVLTSIDGEKLIADLRRERDAE